MNFYVKIILENHFSKIELKLDLDFISCNHKLYIEIDYLILEKLTKMLINLNFQFIIYLWFSLFRCTI
jgi:hypothetical protein